MALTYLEKHSVDLTQTGIAMALVPATDATTGQPSRQAVEVWRAPDLAGVPDEANDVVIGTLPALEAGGTVFVDPRPLTTTKYWYRHRHYQGTGFGDFSHWIGPFEAVELHGEAFRTALRIGPGVAAPIHNGHLAGDFRSMLALKAPPLILNGELDVWENPSQASGWKNDLASAAAITRETAVVFSGVASLKYTNPDNASAGGWHGVQTEDPQLGVFCVPLRAGQTYTVRVASRCDQFGAGQQYRVRVVHNVAGTVTSEKRFTYKAANAWQVDVFTFIVPSSAEKHSTIFVEFNRNGSAAATNFYLDSFRNQEVTEFQFFDNGDSGTGAITIDWSLAPTQRIRLTGNVSLYFTGLAPGVVAQLEVVQDGTGNRIVSLWDPLVVWSGGTAPTLTTTGNRSDLLEFSYVGAPGLGDRVLGFFRTSNHPFNDVQTAVGSLLVSSADVLGTTYTISGLPFLPKLILFQTSGRSDATDADGLASAQRSFGAATGAAARRNLSCSYKNNTGVALEPAHDSTSITAVIQELDDGGGNTVTGLLDLDAINADGFRLIIDDQFASSRRIFWMAVGGSTFNASIGTATEPAATGNFNIAHGLGVAPTGAIFFGSDKTAEGMNGEAMFGFGFSSGSAAAQNFVAATMSDDAINTVTNGYGFSGECRAIATIADTIVRRAVLSSFDATNIVLNYTEVTGTAHQLYWIAITGCKVRVGNIATLTDTTSDINPGSLGQRPRGIIFASVLRATSTQDTVSAEDEFSLGFVSIPAAGGAPTQLAMASSSRDAVANTDAGAGIAYNAAYLNLAVADGLKEGRMIVREIMPDHFLARMDDADPSANRVGFLAIGV